MCETVWVNVSMRFPIFGSHELGTHRPVVSVVGMNACACACVRHKFALYKWACACLCMFFYRCMRNEWIVVLLLLLFTLSAVSLHAQTWTLFRLIHIFTCLFFSFQTHTFAHTHGCYIWVCLKHNTYNNRVIFIGLEWACRFLTFVWTYGNSKISNINNNLKNKRGKKCRFCSYYYNSLQ